MAEQTQNTGFGEQNGFGGGFGEQNNGGFGGGFGGTGFEGGAGFGDPTVQPQAQPQGDPSQGGTISTGAKFEDIPISQINGLQGAKYASYEDAQEAIHQMTTEEIVNRKNNSEQFKWKKTVIDKEDWETDEKGNRKLKSPKFLGWLVERADTNGQEIPMTNDQLLAYIAGHCSQNGIIGSGDTGLRLRYSMRDNKSAKSGNYKATLVITLAPLNKKLSKYAEGRVVAAKEPLWNDDGTPKMILRPGKKADSTDPNDRVQEYGFKQGFEIFKKKRTTKDKKNDQKSQKAFNVLFQIYGGQSVDAL